MESEPTHSTLDENIGEGVLNEPRAEEGCDKCEKKCSETQTEINSDTCNLFV